MALTVGCTAVHQQTELETLKTAADHGDPQAQFRLGQKYYAKHDYTKAAELWKLAAAQGVLAAYSNFGFLTYYGKGVDKNLGEAIRIWKYTAEQGFPEAHRHLGTAYMEGNYLHRDPQEAYAHFRAAIILAAKSSESIDKMVAMRATTFLEAARNELNQTQIEQAELLAVQYAKKTEKEPKQ